ncbi:MAG: DUF4157 domain-containing protein [bacterium]|nr:DUF4157 domain-containing protein [bacterium]
MNNNGKFIIQSKKSEKVQKKDRILQNKPRSSDPTVDYIMQLQRTIGNNSVEHLIKNNIIQPDLIERQLNNMHREEAVSASESILRQKAPGVMDDLNAIRVQPKGSSAGSFAVDSSVESGIRSMKGGGQALSSSANKYYQSRFGHDFSNVKIHTGSKADNLSKAINARAFTTGNDIFFANGEYSPATRTGKMLLAHELTHVVQQGGTAIKRDVPKNKKKPAKPKATKKAGLAGAHAEKLLKQTNPAIWFDDWGGDGRDNDLDNKIDEKNEKKSYDGAHYGRTYKGRICSNDTSKKTTDKTCTSKTIKVIYWVCIDVPKACYKKAGIPFPPGRRVVKTVKKLKKRYTRSFKIMLDNGKRKNGFDGTLLPGDFVAELHDRFTGHSGIVGSDGQIIHLPGPSRGNFPSGKNDLMKYDFKPTYVFRPQR